MSDLENLKRLAASVDISLDYITDGRGKIIGLDGELANYACSVDFLLAANPQAILSLIERVEKAERDAGS